MAATKNHDYHLVEPDPWPLIGAMSGGVLFSGAVMWFHENRYGVPVLLLGLAGVLITMYNWWSNTISEAHARRSYARRAAPPALRNDPVHRLRGDVLPRMVLGLLRQLTIPVAQ